jgi:signal transduction histidine kinase
MRDDVQIDTGGTREQEPMWFAYGVVPYVALAVALVLALLVGSGSARYVGAAIGLSAAAAAWLATMRVPFALREVHTVRGPVFYLGLLAFIGVLIILNPFFAIFGFSGYLYVILLPGLWKVAGMVVNAGFMAVSEVGGVSQMHGVALLAYAGLFAVNVFIVGSMTKAGIDDEKRAEQRTRTIDQLSEANRRLEQMMEENAGLHAQLVAQAREAGVFDERQRMAGEIHDTLAQGLTGILAQLEAADLAEPDPVRRRRHLDLARNLARDSLAEARRSVQALRPQMLEGARLPEALRELARQWTETSGIPVRAGVDGDARPLQPALEVVLFRAAQEALANVAKHADARQVGMTLTYMHDLVSLDVLDDGCGFESEAGRPATAVGAQAAPAGEGGAPGGSAGVSAGGSAGCEAGSAANGVATSNGSAANGSAVNGAPVTAVNGTGYGLSAMRRRLRQVGGNLEIESAPGDGTTLSASVPALYRAE